MNEDLHLPKSEFMSVGVDISCDSRHICCSKEEPHCPANRHLCQQPALDNTYISPSSWTPGSSRPPPASFMGIIHTSLRLYSSLNFPGAMRSECWSSNGCSADPRRTPAAARPRPRPRQLQRRTLTRLLCCTAAPTRRFYAMLTGHRRKIFDVRLKIFNIPIFNHC